MLNLAKKLRRLGLNESGAATVEFVIVFPFFVGIFLSAFEVAMMNIRAVMMERAMDLTVREIRLSSGADLDYDTVLANVCAQTTIIPDCENVLRIELQAVDRANFAGIQNRPDCVKRNQPIQPLVRFKNGVENELMLIRICAVIDPFFPGIGVGRSMPLDESGGYQVIASSAFVNEPK
ncbi:MAG: pilus assembly protein, partial [Silicimonas sp.]|nr:pilus assembly protein [Silicimonas sp.]